MLCRVVSVAVAAALVVAGCTSGGDSDVEQVTSSTAVSTTVSASTTTTVPAPSTTAAPTTTLAREALIGWEYTSPTDLPVVTLLEAGEEPLSLRRYAAEVGTSRTTTMRLETAIEQSIDGEETTNVETVAVVEFTSTVVAVDEEGITIEETYGSGSVEATDPLAVYVTEAAYAQLEGVTTHTLMSPRGEILALSTAGLPPDLAEMTQGMSAAAIPLPVAPIGVGAEWETVSTVESGGITFIQTTLVRLAEIDGPLLTLETATTQTLGPDGFAALGVQTVETDFVSTGYGSAIWNLEGPFPIEVSSKVDQTLRAVFSVDDEQATLDQTMTLTLELQPSRDTEAVSTIAQGKLSVCSQVPYLSFEFEDPASPSGYSGFDIELMHAIAQELGLELVVVTRPFDGIWLQPAAGACDVVASAMTITEDRARYSLFSDPYFNNALSLMVTAANDGLTLSDTDGMSIGVETGTSGEMYATQNKPRGADLVSFDDAATLFRALESGSVEATLIDLSLAGDRAFRNPDLRITETYETDEQYGLGMAIENEGLATQINNALKTLKENGAYGDLHEKYFGIRGTSSPDTVDRS